MHTHTHMHTYNTNIVRTFIMHGAIPEQGVTTLLTHRSCMIKLQTAKEKERESELVERNDVEGKHVCKCHSMRVKQWHNTHTHTYLHVHKYICTIISYILPALI